MKQILSEKYTIAWFKIAECIARGEKERALGVYRLLSYSLDDPAFAAQLEGDILLSFSDVLAIEKYHQAAHLYRQSDRLVEAATMYEYVLTLMPECSSTKRCLLSLYKQLGLTTKIAYWLHHLIELEVQAGVVDKALHLMDELDELAYTQWHALAYQKVMWALLNADHVHMKKIIQCMHKTLDALILCHDTKTLNQFMVELKVSYPEIHTKACTYLEQE